MPTTNHTSRAPNRKSRAADSRLIAGSFENTSRNFAPLRPAGSPCGINRATATRITARPAAIASTEGRKPTRASSEAPSANPSPLIAFFDPVRIATQRKRLLSPSGTSSLTALFADILARSLATPDSPCTAITKGTETAIVQPGSSRERAASATTCSASPA